VHSALGNPVACLSLRSRPTMHLIGNPLACLDPRSRPSMHCVWALGRCTLYPSRFSFLPFSFLPSKLRFMSIANRRGTSARQAPGGGHSGPVPDHRSDFLRLLPHPWEAQACHLQHLLLNCREVAAGAPAMCRGVCVGWLRPPAKEGKHRLHRRYRVPPTSPFARPRGPRCKLCSSL
jgi:hypothetical protein